MKSANGIAIYEQACPPVLIVLPAFSATVHIMRVSFVVHPVTLVVRHTVSNVAVLFQYQLW